MEADSSSKG